LPNEPHPFFRFTPFAFHLFLLGAHLLFQRFQAAAFLLINILIALGQNLRTGFTQAFHPGLVDLMFGRQGIGFSGIGIPKGLKKAPYTSIGRDLIP
jgi:hypothetical protein